MSIDEALDVTRIYSVADQLPPGIPLIQSRPITRSSTPGWCAAATYPPGEISLAHRGVLFLNELPEFGSRVLEVLRQPKEDKVVTISRALSPSRPISSWLGLKSHARVIINHNELLIVRVWSPAGIA